MINNGKQDEKKLDRMNTFVDAVLAIVITLLVLELHLPKLSDENSDGELFDKMKELLPHFYAFMLCFLAVLQYWVSHNAFCQLIGKYHNTLGIIAIVCLLPYCLLPFSASIIGEYPHNPGSYMFFGALYLFGTIMASINLKYMWHKKVFAEGVDLDLFEEKIMKFWWVSPIIAALLMFSSYISTTLAKLLYIVMLSLWLYMTRSLKVLVRTKTPSR
jgi:uncharacterized membrane protein